jgi:hypothetical protein
MAKSRKQQLADEAYLRNQQAFEQTTLPIDGPARTEDLPRLDKIPTTCPGCGQERKVRVGGWTLVVGDIVQCGACGYRAEVPRESWERYGKALHDAYAIGAVTGPPRRGSTGPRTRGAG